MPKVHETKTTEKQDQRRGHINWDLLHHTGCSLEGLETIVVSTEAMEELMKGALKIKIEHRHGCWWRIKKNRRLVREILASLESLQ